MPDPGVIRLLTGREFREACRNRWFVIYATLFAALALALSWMGTPGLQNYGLAEFGRTSAGLVNLVVLIIPLMGITLGALGLASERENGTLRYLCSHPVSLSEVLLGKFLGQGLALLSAVAAGFAAAGLLIAGRGGDRGAEMFLSLAGLSFLLCLISLGLGLLISASVNRSSMAVGCSVFVWTVLVFMGDLGVLGSSIVLKLNVHQLLMTALVNPLHVFKMAALLAVEGHLEFLGPAGHYAVREYGSRFFPALLGILAAWTVVPLALTFWVFKRKGVC